MERWSPDECHRQPPRALPRAPRGDPAAARCVLTRRSERRWRPARSFGPTCVAKSDGRSPSSAGSGCARGTSPAPRRPCLPRTAWAGSPSPGLALVRLAQGDAPAAAASIREALDRPLRVPSKELPPDTDLQRAPLLEAQVEIEIAAGDLGQARAAADELTEVATRFESKALVAGATLARGRVRLADGDAAEAERLLRRGRTIVERDRRALRGGARANRARRGVTSRWPRGPSRSRAQMRRARSSSRSSSAPRRDDRDQRLPPRGRLLVRGVRRAHGAGPRSQGHAVPRAAPRPPWPRVPRAGPRRG